MKGSSAKSVSKIVDFSTLYKKFRLKGFPSHAIKSFLYFKTHIYLLLFELAAKQNLISN